MFTQSDFRLIDKSYFDIINQNAYTVTLYSRNTGHCWHIIKQIYNHNETYQIYHTHKIGTAYHLHGHTKSFKLALLSICDHDVFQLAGRK